MNKYLEIAQKVLADSQSMLTARQIWDSAERRGFVSNCDFGAYPWRILGSALSREVNQHNQVSAFGTSRDKQICYYLLAISDLWGTLEGQADLMENIDPTILLNRIRSRPPQPQPKIIAVSVYNRDPNVIAYVRRRAKYCCEMCGILGFQKESGHPYIEVHHLKRLADGGSDIPENAVALCANCHRKLHHIFDRNALLSILIAELTAKGIEIKPQ